MVSSSDISGAITSAARAVLIRRGYAETSIKAIAAAAGVAPEVVSSLYRNRDEVLTAALRLPFDPAGAIPQLVGPGLDGMGERIVRASLALMHSDQIRSDILALGRVASNDGVSDAVALLRGGLDLIQESVVDKALVSLGVPDARMRGALITAYVAGIMVTRYVVRVEPLASAQDDDVVAMVAPVIQRLVDPRTPLTGAR